MRTMVEPAATAASRSSLMPMERSSSPRASARAPEQLEGLLGRTSAGGRHRHESPHVEPEIAELGHQLGGGRGRATVTAGQARRLDLHEDPGLRGETGDPLALGHPGHALPDTHQRSELGHLVALDRTQEVPRDAGGLSPSPDGPDRGGLRDQLRRIVLAQVGQPRVHGCTDGLGTETLGDADHPHPGGITAGALDPLPDGQQPSRDLVASEGRRGRRNRRLPGRAPLRPRWRRRRCPPARAWKRSSTPGHRPSMSVRCPLPSARTRPQSR